MKRRAVAVIVVVCSLMGAGCGSERYAHNNRERHESVDTLNMMTKDDVVALSKAKVSDDVILSQVDVTGSYFELSTQDIIDLTNAGVSEKVISGMIKTDNQPQSSTQAGGYPHYSSYYWYTGYPFVYPWYPSFFPGFSSRYHRPNYSHHGSYFPHHTSFVHRGFSGGHSFHSGVGRGFGGSRSGGRHR